MYDFSTVSLPEFPAFVPPPPPPPPPPAPAAEGPAPAAPAPADTLAVGQNAGAMASASGYDFGPMPFDVGGVPFDFVGPLPFEQQPTVAELPEGPLKEAAVATAEAIVTTSAETNAAFIDGLRGTFTEAGIAALEGLNAGGQLDAPDASGGPNLRDSIKGFLAGGGAAATAEAVVREVADPGAISQICNNTCAASTAQAGWAASAPAEYFRAAADLATKGTATITRAGRPVTLQVDEGYGGWSSTQNMAAIKAAGLEGVDKVDASVQAALMNLGSNGVYDIRSDKLVTTQAVGTYDSFDLNLTGLSLGESQGLFQSLLSSPFSTALTLQYQGEGDATWRRDSAAELETMKAALASGTKFSYTMVGAQRAQVSNMGRGEYDSAGAYGGGTAAAHAVAVIGLKDGNVQFYDPQGKIQTASETEFLGMMDGVDPNAVMMEGIGGGSAYGSGAGYVRRYPR